ncbi:hypothetical protein K450DRAFT_235550 [Umbelopsis ramanniana AG]|uniref:RING-type domain-containing protein n=1 Tax=Umbelopsis ramanniana AG TaxID=1314678 RepID=A0AAD5EBK8_UMBRA|nr:uncharacterized protein K450DRAFT_235550 [Umbelopsis ramanniana AG]KAI8580703.1 hypothetical protein K450DRAFT_235550 [Umbelopsis ramanniana AG]
MPNALLAPADVHGLTYRGFIEINNEEHYIEIQQVSPSTLTGAKLYGSPKLRRLLHTHNKTILQQMSHASNIRMFLSDLTNLLERKSQNAEAQEQEVSKKVATMSTKQYEILLSQLNTIGMENVVYMDPGLKSFHLSIRDSSGRQHIVYIDLPEGSHIYPLNVIAELPCEMPTFSVKTNIPTVISAIRDILNDYQKLFDELDNLDANSWVLDPVRPTRRDTQRRLALGHHCTLHLEIKHTKNPCEAPDLQLFGAESRIAVWKEAINRNMAAWDGSKPLLDNILRVLELPKLPQRDNFGDNSADVECGICYAYHLNTPDTSATTKTPEKEQTPSLICNNETCGRAFHHRCMYEWLRSVPTTRQSFDVLFGFCPYCNQDITSKVILL